jgi:F-type H+-transporting ATPase subunit b
VNINIPQIFFVIVNVVILYAAMYRFFFRPVQEFLSKREAHVKNEIAAAEQSRAEAAQLVEEYEEKLRHAKEEARRIIEEASQQAASTRAQIEAEAREQAELMLKRAERAISLERDKALAALRDEIGELSLLAAGHLLGQKMDPETDQRLVQEFITELDKTYVQ